MEKMTKYRQLLRQILEGHSHVSASFPSEGIERLLIMDEERGYYMLMRLGWQDQKRIKWMTVFARIKDGKIWIEQDLTEEGTILNHRYRILRLLRERGGMGLVYLAADLNLRDTVVIKQSRYNDEAFLRQMFPDLKEVALRSQAEYLREAFEREARLLFGLRHIALPRVLDYFNLDGQQSLVMEFIPGKDLGEMLAERAQRNQGAFPLDMALGWADQLLDALSYLHTHFDAPIIHRDIKRQA
jgi:serine/threonine protein kinase